MWDIAIKLRRWLLVFLIIVNIGVPLVDSLTCSNHNISRLAESNEIQAGYTVSNHINLPSGKNDKNMSDNEGGQGHCPICFYAQGLPVSHNENNIFTSIYYVIKSVNIMFLEHFSSIYKPPKNL